jgi:DNA-binding NarL/FixJ family response regulator
MLASYWLASAEDLEIVGTASTVEMLIEQAPAVLPDVVVLDHLLGASDSLDAAPRVRAAIPEAALLLLSGMPDPALAEAAAACGADGFISKACSPDQFCAAIRAVSRRGDGLSGVADPDKPNRDARARGRDAAATKRDMDAAVRDGLSDETSAESDRDAARSDREAAANDRLEAERDRRSAEIVRDSARDSND